mgnify:CR=1 FL=1
MDKDLQKALENVIKREIGDLISRELQIRFKTISNAVETIQKSNDNISNQIREDRQDINQLKIDVAKIAKQTGVIIENQNSVEDRMASVVEDEAKKIPQVTKKAVENMFEKKAFLKRIKERFIRGVK